MLVVQELTDVKVWKIDRKRFDKNMEEVCTAWKGQESGESWLSGEEGDTTFKPCCTFTRENRDVKRGVGELEYDLCQN